MTPAGGRRFVALCTAGITQANDASETTSDCISVTADNILDMAGTTGGETCVSMKEYAATVFHQIRELANTAPSDLPIGMPPGCATSMT